MLPCTPQDLSVCALMLFKMTAEHVSLIGNNLFPLIFIFVTFLIIFLVSLMRQKNKQTAPHFSTALMICCGVSFQSLWQVYRKDYLAQNVCFWKEKIEGGTGIFGHTQHAGVSCEG